MWGPRNILVVFAVLHSVLEWSVVRGQVNGVYSVIAPGTIRPNSTYTVGVSVHSQMETCDVELRVTSEKFTQKMMVQITEMSTRSVKFDIPDIENGTYKLIAESKTLGCTFSNTKPLVFVDNHPGVYIQTDKAKYKPGDVVHFRAIFLDAKLKPAVVRRKISVYVKDVDQNLIQNKDDVKLTKGVYVGSLQLSTLTNLGNWTIGVSIDGKEVKQKEIEVAEYVLPEFEVRVKTRPKIAITEEKLAFDIIARYTYGKPVKGEALITVETLKLSKLEEIRIKGKEHREFDLKELFPQRLQNNMIQSLLIRVKVKDDLTGNEVSKETSVEVKPEPYNMKVPSIDGKCENATGRFQYSVSVTDVEDKPMTKGRVEFKPTFSRGISYPMFARLDPSGIATIKGNCRDYRALGFTIKFKDMTKTVNAPINVDPCGAGAGLTVLTERPSLVNPIALKIAYPQPFSNFVYTILSHGNIVETQKKTLYPQKCSNVFHIYPTPDMAPNCTIYVQILEESELRVYSVDLQIEREFENRITISAPPVAKPGSYVELNIKTNVGSYVGLLAVDKSVLLLKSGNDFSLEEILYQTKADAQMGPIIMSNAKVIEIKEVIVKSGDDANEIVRRRFLETWLFADFDNVNRNGIQYQSQIPDTITDWVIMGFSLHPETGFTLTKTPTEIITFQEFFIKAKLPYSVKSDEIVTIPVVVFNYMNQLLNARVHLEVDSNEFDIVSDDRNLTFKFVDVEPQSAQTVHFNIKPKVDGSLTLKIKADSLNTAHTDSIEKTLLVVPEGDTKRFDISHQLVNSDTYVLDLNIPLDIVPSSQHVVVSVTGSILGTTLTTVLENNDYSKLIKLPYGCGEQNMYNFVPAIMVLKYLKAVGEEKRYNQVLPSATNVMQIGYQRELTYKHPNGAFSTWGPSDASGGTWLTAYVIRSFHMAKEFITIDPSIFEKGLIFLASKQQADGSFAEHRATVDFAHQNTLGLTASVLWAFLEIDKHKNAYTNTIDKAFRYLENHIRNENDFYASSIALYMLQKRNKDLAREIFGNIDKEAQQTAEGGKWWSQSKKSNRNLNNHNVEVTSYILLALLEMGGQDVLPIVNWLLSKRNGEGGFGSSQETVVGLMALISYEMTKSSTKDAMTVDIKHSNSPQVATFTINEENKFVAQKAEYSNVAQLTFTSKGYGTVMLHVMHQYNVMKTSQTHFFSIDANCEQSQLNPDSFLLNLGLRYTPPPDDMANFGIRTNMVLMHVNLPTGFQLSPDPSAFGQAEGLKKVETENGESLVILYLDSFSELSTDFCIKMKVNRVQAVWEEKPSLIFAYDYYETQKRGETFYLCGD